MNEQPILVSVTLPNYNHGRFLRQALESVLQQSYPHIEILFVDDGSTDDSRAVAEEIAERDSRLKPVFFVRNQGVLRALDNAWSRASGDLLFQYSSDDALLDSHFFQRGVDALKAYPSAAGFYGTALVVSGETGCELGNMGSGLRDGYIAPEEFIREFLRGRIFVPGISSLWRRSLINEVGGYDNDLGAQADYFINHALPARWGVVFYDKPVALARSFEGRTSYSSDTSTRVRVERMALFERKMRSVIPAYIEQGVDWAVFRRTQVRLLSIRDTHLQRAITGGGKRLRQLLPERVYVVVRLLWRRSVALLLPPLIRFDPRYRAVAKQYEELLSDSVELHRRR